MTAIWGSGADGQWHTLEPVAFQAEAQLHDLVENAPQMLPLAGSPRLTVLGRELRLGHRLRGPAGRGVHRPPGDHRGQAGGNAESRRAVVAQVLSYAGYLQGLDLDQLESQILGVSVLAAVQGSDQQHAVDAEEFRDGLARSLAEGSFRLVIVLDSAPDELVQVVGYLQSITDKIDVDLVTVSAYDVAGSLVLVPQRIDPGRRGRELSDAQVTAQQAGVLHRGSAEFRLDIASMPPAQRDPLVRLADWADTLEKAGLVKLTTFRGRNGRITLQPRATGHDAGLVTIYSENRTAYLQFFRSVFECRAPRSIPAVEAILGTTLKQGNWTPEIPDALLDAIAKAYQEAAGNPRP
jgi:hypothetical protein